MSPSSSRVVVIGAGPVGIDAALAAVRLGLRVRMFEAGPTVATHVRAWGHVRLFTPWDMVISPRMAAALMLEGHSVPDGPPPTGAELVQRVLEPLVQGKALSGTVRYETRVVSVGKAGLLKHEEIGTGARGGSPFRVLLAGPGGEEWIEEADLVVDCSGTWGNPNPLGAGGVPAPGETGCGVIGREIPNVASDPALQGRRILVVGGGHSAMTAVRDLGHLAQESPDTRVHWAVRSQSPAPTANGDDPLPFRRALVEEVSALVQGASPPVELLRGVEVGEVRETDVGTRVRLLSGSDVSGDLLVDRIFSLTGSVGDREIYRQLQVHECYATQGPMKLAAALLAADTGADCLDQVSHGADALANPEPGFYILGAKSYGRNNTFLLRVGYDQVTDVFAQVAKRAGAAA